MFSSDHENLDLTSPPWRLLSPTSPISLPPSPHPPPFCRLWTPVSESTLQMQTRPVTILSHLGPSVATVPGAAFEALFLTVHPCTSRGNGKLYSIYARKKGGYRLERKTGGDEQQQRWKRKVTWWKKTASCQLLLFIPDMTPVFLMTGSSVRRFARDEDAQKERTMGVRGKKWETKILPGSKGFLLQKVFQDPPKPPLRIPLGNVFKVWLWKVPCSHGWVNDMKLSTVKLKNRMCIYSTPYGLFRKRWSCHVCTHVNTDGILVQIVFHTITNVQTRKKLIFYD